MTTDTERLDLLEQALRIDRTCSFTVNGKDMLVHHGPRTAYGWTLRELLDNLLEQRVEMVAEKITK